MGFDNRDTATVYTPQEGDTLHTIAERETANGNPVTWQDLARFNWGTDDEDEVNAFLRDELGTRKRDANNDFVISTEDEPQGDLLIPRRFQKEGLPVEQVHVIRVRRKVTPPQFIACCSIPGTTFAYDQSFIRPSVVDHLEPLQAALDAHPEAKVMIFGHTDKVGTEAYNKDLSERRALSAFAFITNDAAIWETLYNQEQWGTKAIQEILKDFDDPAFDPGPVDGVYGAKTQEAVRNFQEAHGLTVDGVAGPVTREVLFTEYMTNKHDIEATPERFMDPKHMGCGEFNPVEETEAAHEPNRRVTFFLFHPDRLPNLPCRHGDLAPCHKQIDPPLPRHTPSFHCSFFDSIAHKCACEQGLQTLDLRLFDSQHEAISNAPYRITIGESEVREGAADPTGRLLEFDIAVPNEVHVEWDFPSEDESPIEAFSFQLIVFLDATEGDDTQTAEKRLHNLGYPFEVLEDNLRAFQRDFGITPVNGVLDAKTKSSLQQVHDQVLSRSEFMGTNSN